MGLYQAERRSRDFVMSQSVRQLILRYHSTGPMTKVQSALRRTKLPVTMTWVDGAWEFSCPANTDDLKLLALEKIVLGFVAFYGKS